MWWVGVHRKRVCFLERLVCPKEKFLTVLFQCILNKTSEYVYIYILKNITSYFSNCLFIKAFYALFVSLTLWCITSQNDQIHFKNLAANATRFLKCVWSCSDVMCQGWKSWPTKKLCVTWFAAFKDSFFNAVFSVEVRIN